MNTIKYAVVDIEATGPNITDSDRIIQIAATIYQNNEKINEHNMLINPEIMIPHQISKLTGIEQRDVLNAPKIEQVISLWYEQLKDCIFIGHNLAFDLRIMKEIFASHDFDFDPPAIDTFLLSKIIYPTSNGYSLSDLAEFLNVELLEAHNALADVKFTSILVNNMAETIASLPDSLRDKLMTLAEYLPHDEKLIFEKPHLFMNDEKLILIERNQKERDVSSHDEILSDYIVEQWQYKNHLVIENRTFPLKRENLFLLALKMSAQTPLIIVVQNDNQIQQWQNYLQKNTEKEWSTLKKQQMYLNGELLETIEQKLNSASLNQTELITWMAMMHYYTVFESSDLSVINKELKMVELLHKLADDYHIQMPPNKAYYQQRQKVKQSQRIILSMGNFLNLYQQRKITDLLPQSATIFFEDAKALLDVGLFFQQHTIHLSQMMNRVQEMLDDVSSSRHSSDVSNQRFRTTLQKLITQIHQLIVYLEQKISDTDINFEKRTFYISRDDTTFKAMLQNIFDLNDRLLNESHTHLNDELDGNLKALSIIQDSMRQNTEPYYWSYTGEVVNQKLYHVQLVLNRIKWPHGFWLDISEHFNYILVSPGNYHYKEKFGLYDRLGSPIGDYLPVNETNKPSVTIDIPASYLSDSNSQNNEDRFELNIQAFIKEQKNDKYLLIVTNQDTLLACYQALSNEDSILSDYLVQVKGTHGSMRRMVNRVKNETKFIMVMTTHDLHSSSLDHLPDDMTVLLQKLPFISPDKPEIQAFNELTQDEQLVFDSINFPMMIQRLKNMVMILGFRQNYYLFDDRVYTRIYSNRLQKMLAPIIQFEWQMTDDDFKNI